MLNKVMLSYEEQFDKECMVSPRMFDKDDTYTSSLFDLIKNPFDDEPFFAAYKLGLIIKTIISNPELFYCALRQKTAAIEALKSYVAGNPDKAREYAMQIQAQEDMVVEDTFDFTSWLACSTGFLQLYKHMLTSGIEDGVVNGKRIEDNEGLFLFAMANGGTFPAVVMYDMLKDRYKNMVVWSTRFSTYKCHDSEPILLEGEMDMIKSFSKDRLTVIINEDNKSGRSLRDFKDFFSQRLPGQILTSAIYQKGIDAIYIPDFVGASNLF